MPADLTKHFIKPTGAVPASADKVVADGRQNSLGALLCTGASFLQMRGYVGEKTGKAMNWAGYGVMGASMLLFVLAGLRGVQP